MKKEHLIPLAIVFLGITILIGSSQIVNQLQLTRFGSNNNVNVNTREIGKGLNRMADEIKNLYSNKKNAMYLSETADYLGLTYKELKYLIEEKKLNIPYLKIDNKYVFYRNSIDHWLLETEQIEFKLK